MSEANNLIKIDDKEWGTKISVRTVTAKEITYIRVEDVANLIEELAATEETDVRNRLFELVRNINKLQKDTE